MINIDAKLKSYRIERINELAKIELQNKTEIWQKWAVYNLSFRIRHINKLLLRQ